MVYCYFSKCHKNVLKFDYILKFVMTDNAAAIML